jgi:hypothetical protein
MWNQLWDALAGAAAIDPATLPPSRERIEQHILFLRDKLKGIQVELDEANTTVNKSVDQLRRMSTTPSANSSEAQILRVNLAARMEIQKRFNTVSDELTKMHASLLSVDTARNERNSDRVRGSNQKTEYEAAAEIVDMREQHILQMNARRQRQVMQSAFADLDANSTNRPSPVQTEMEGILASLRPLPGQSAPIPNLPLPAEEETVEMAVPSKATA